MNGPTQLYRHFDDAGRLLYVGISLSAINRFIAHRSSSQWSGHVARIEIEKFPTRLAALTAESRAIETERPLFNIAGMPKKRKRKNSDDGWSPKYPFDKLEIGDSFKTNCTSLPTMERQARAAGRKLHRRFIAWETTLHGVPLVVVQRVAHD